ncbi:ester cyclase [Planktotalea sp.]|uniref:ester cyclase n=1 Tax=Planktotalea sp. TaxID=2029877 RepID=UPI0025D53EA2|nr:ester cyclase [Planktotalea sp.]
MNTARDNANSIHPLLAALRDFDAANVQTALKQHMTPDAVVHMCHPFGDLSADTFYDSCFAPLAKAIPDLERRDTILVSGQTPEGNDWIGCCGSYIGTFAAPFLDIPPTGHLAHMRFHEFYRIVDGLVVEVQAIWDIPELMMQANAWPMAPSLGREWHTPGPITQDGLTDATGQTERAQYCQNQVLNMLTALTRHPAEPVEAMELERFWHPKMTWYGPAGIGTARGIAGFRHWHQIPFLNAMPDRGQFPDETTFHFFAEGDYVAVTGWPDMVQTVTGSGWMGIAPNGQKIEMRSIDFWRLDGGKIRENWVLVDLLDVYRQLGVDVFARLREFNKARNMSALNFPVGDSA